MKKMFFAASLMLLFTPILALAQSAFHRTWKIDMNKADGQDQTVTGHPYYDTVAIKVIGDHEIEETDKKNGKTVSTSKTTVSSDGNTMSFEFSDSSNTNAAPVKGKGERNPRGQRSCWIESHFRFVANLEIRGPFRQRDYVDVQGQRRRVGHDQSDWPILQCETERDGSTVQR